MAVPQIATIHSLELTLSNHALRTIAQSLFKQPESFQVEPSIFRFSHFLVILCQEMRDRAETLWLYRANVVRACAKISASGRSSIFVWVGSNIENNYFWQYLKFGKLNRHQLNCLLPFRLFEPVSNPMLCAGAETWRV